MSLAFGLAHPHWFQLSGKFNPLSLFSAGEQGIAVPDLTPGNSFLFQDSAGTTPVTAYEQPVGLILDRSKGLVLGADVLGGAGSFSSATGWTQGTGWSIGSGVATATAGFGTTLSYLATLTVGSTYRIDVQASSVTGGTLTMQLRGGTIVSAPSITADGTYTFYLTAVTGNNSVGCTKSPTFAGVIDNFIVRELPGNHIIQATSTKRPTLSARYNLLTYTEDLSNAVWDATQNKVISVNTAETTDPLGGNTADKYTATATISYVAQSVATTAITYTASCYAKRGNTDWVLFGLFLATDYNAYFNLANGTVGTITGSVTTSIADAGNGWWRLVVTKTMPSGGTLLFSAPSPRASDGGASANGLTAYIWGADLRRTIDTIGMPAYQRVGASNDYDTAGFFPYLAFDGTDDSMATAASVDFSASDKLAVASGVTKLSDAAEAIIVELSTVASVPGTFVINTPFSATNSAARFLSRGTSAGQSLSGALPAPISLVLTGVGDISGDVSMVRVNGLTAATSTSDQGTGNYGNYPVFLGARNNSTSFFNGRMYPFFIRGAATDAGLIAQVEQFLKARMPVSF